MEERFTIDYKIKLAKYDDKMYKLIVFFLITMHCKTYLSADSTNMNYNYKHRVHIQKTHLLIFEGDENILIMKSFSQILLKSMGK